MACHHVHIVRRKAYMIISSWQNQSAVVRRFASNKSPALTICEMQHQQMLFSTNTVEKDKKVHRGLILGVYEPESKDEEMELSEAAENVNVSLAGHLMDLLKISGGTLKAGKVRIFHGIDNKYNSIAAVGLGKRSAGFNKEEDRKDCKENIRIAVAAGVKSLREAGCNKVKVDPCSDAQAAAEGAYLSVFNYDELKAKSNQKPTVDLSLWINTASNDNDLWVTGRTFAKSQNLARRLMEMPANKLTPSAFSEIVTTKLVDACSYDQSKLTVRSHQQDWIERQNMGAFLSVAKGSKEPPVFLEVSYNGGASSEKPLVLVGKGVTFDSGGISLKPSQGMDLMRGDMGGAANVAGALWAAIYLQLPVNLVGLVPLCENLPSGVANKPGDVVTAMNGKTIQVDNTDAEGRLLLADALCYACKKYDPATLVDLATLTGAIDVALGSGATGVFSNNTKLWKLLCECGVETGDRLWRMPLWQHYTKQVTESQLADLNNIGKYSRSGGSCTAAAFLKEFVTCSSWAHLDIAGVMQNKDEVPYLGKGMSGRPVRTLIEFISRHAKS